MNTKMKKSILLVVILVLASTAASCSGLPVGMLAALLDGEKQSIKENGEVATGEAIGLANPAAQYCAGLGYALESVDREGGVDADCVFPDGERCSQWDFLAGRCGQEMSFCALLGGTIQASGNLGTCVFFDGSTCNELELFYGECSVGDNPGQTGQEAHSEDIVKEEEESGEPPQEAISITDFISARDYLIAYLVEEYRIEILESWMETDISSPGAAGVNTFRYVSGPLTLVLSAEASAPYASLYQVQEATDRATGFWWTGTVAIDGTISESEVILPWSILNPEDSRDAGLDYLAGTYGISSPGEWLDEGTSQAGNAGISRRYSSGTWLVVVEFEPAAPMVSSYRVSIEESSSKLRWEGNVSGHGEIEQISFVQ